MTFQHDYGILLCNVHIPSIQDQHLVHDPSPAIVDLPLPILASPSNILSKEATTRLSLQQVSTAHSSSKATRGRGIVDPANTVRVVHDVHIDHSRALFVIKTELAASRCIPGSGKARVLHDVGVRCFVGDSAVVDQI
jgi:hypothetical protein